MKLLAVPGARRTRAAASEVASPSRMLSTYLVTHAVTLQLVPSGPDMNDDTFYDAMLTAIGAAQSRIALVSAYYVPDENVQRALVLAARRGVRTVLVVPTASNHPLADFARRGLVRELASAGVVVRGYALGMLHAKALVVDDDFAYVGSPNFDMRSFFLNYEDAIFLLRPCVGRCGGGGDRRPRRRKPSGPGREEAPLDLRADGAPARPRAVSLLP